MKETIISKGTEIVVISGISLTDIARYKSDDRNDVIKNWLHSKDKIEFLGFWEQLVNLNFKPVEFNGLRNENGGNVFTVSPAKWIESANAIGIRSVTGRYGGAFAYKRILV